MWIVSASETPILASIMSWANIGPSMSTMVVWRPDEYDLASAVKEEVAMKTPLRAR